MPTEWPIRRHKTSSPYDASGKANPERTIGFGPAIERPPLTKKYHVVKLYNKRYLIPAQLITPAFRDAELKIVLSQVNYNEIIEFTILEKSALEDALFSTQTFVDI